MPDAGRSDYQVVGHDFTEPEINTKLTICLVFRYLVIVISLGIAALATTLIKSNINLVAEVLPVGGVNNELEAVMVRGRILVEGEEVLHDSLALFGIEVRSKLVEVCKLAHVAKGGCSEFGAVLILIYYFVGRDLGENVSHIWILF